MRKVYLFILFFFSVSVYSFSFGQVAGDFRSATSSDWNTSTTWERYNGTTWEASGVGANNPGNIPSATNSVFIQAGHAVSLSNNSSCYDLNLNSTASQNRLALGVYTLNVNGKLRAYTAAVGTVPGAASTPPSTNSWITSTTGKLSIVGNSRNLTNANEWGATNGGTSNPNGFDFELNLNAGQTVFANTSIKARKFVIASGTITVSGANRLAPDQGVVAGSDFVINNGGTVISDATGTGGSAVIGRTTGGAGDVLTVQAGGFLILKGTNPRVAMTTINFNGTVQYDSTVSQTILQSTNSGANPVSYTNLVLGGSGVKTLPATNGTTSVSGSLLISGAASFATNGKLSFKSTGRLAPITSSAASALSGDVTVERPLTSLGNRAYRLLASSVTTTTSIKANWQEGATSNTDNPAPGYGTHITGTTVDQTNGFDGTTSGQASLFTYDQVSSTQAWLPISGTTPNTLDAKKGYLIFIRGDRTPANLTSTASSNTTLRATGTALTGDITYTSLESNGRFSLVTNPYISPINWSTIYNDGTTSNSTNFENFYTYWDPNISTRGAYVTVNATGTNSAGTNATVEIQQGQAFFVKTKSGVSSPTLTIKESHKSSTTNIDVFRVGSPETFRMRLFYDDNGTRKLADGAVELFNNDYSAAVDGNDAEKFANFDENIAIAREGKMLSIEGRPLIDGSDNIPLSIARLKQQQYEWQFDPSSFSVQTLQAYLQDNFLNTKTPISLTTVTVVPFNVTANAASSAADRFTILFTTSAALPISLSSVKASQKLTGIQVEWNVVNEINIDKYEVEKSADGINFVKATSLNASAAGTTIKTYSWFDGSPNADNNYYRIRSLSKTGAVVYSGVVRINLGRGAMALSVYPNPVQGEMIGLQLTNLEKGRYTISVTNQSGQQVYSTVLEHAGGAASQTLHTGFFSKGVYQLQLKGEHANITQQIIKQ